MLVLKVLPLALVVGLLSSPTLQAADKPKEKESDPENVNWGLIDFRDDYRLTKVTLELRKDCGMNYSDGKIVVTETFGSAADLKLFQEALLTARISPPRNSYGAAGVTPNSMLTFDTTRETFRVYWNYGFSLDSEVLEARTHFWSMGLAVLIDRKLRERKQAGLAADLIDDLSGEALLKSEKASFRRIIGK